MKIFGSLAGLLYFHPTLIMALQLPDNYGYVAMSIGFISFVQFFHGFPVMKSRKFFKSKEFLSDPKVKAMQDDHKKAFGNEINDHGYPDMGCGRYSDIMPYKEWANLNNAQRSHYNMVETSGPVLVCLTVGGLYHPKLCAGLGFLYGAGRILYSMGYQAKGADGRMVGAVASAVGMMGLFLTTIVGGVHNSGCLKAIGF